MTDSFDPELGVASNLIKPHLVKCDDELDDNELLSTTKVIKRSGIRISHLFGGR